MDIGNASESKMPDLFLRQSIFGDTFRALIPGPLDFWTFWTRGFGLNFVAIAAVASIVVMRWQPGFTVKWVNRVLGLRHLLLPLPIVALALMMIMPAYLVFETILFNKGSLGIAKDWQALLLIALLPLFGCLGCIGLVSDLCGLGGSTCNRPHGRFGQRRVIVGLEVVSLTGAALAIVAGAIWLYVNFPMGRFAKQIAGADKVWVICRDRRYELPWEAHRTNIVITGSDVSKVVAAVTGANRDMMSYKNPYAFLYQLDFVRNDALCGSIVANGRWFLIDGKQYCRTEGNVFDSLVFAPAESSAREQFDRYKFTDEQLRHPDHVPFDGCR